MNIRISHPDRKANFSIVYLTDLMIAFALDDDEVVVRVNEWGPTTERHMQHVNHNAKRVPGAVFERRLAAALSPFSIAERP